MAETGSLKRVSSGPYSPLNIDAHEIRLLRLEPGAFEDDLHITLEVASLDHQPNFEALSYVWGTTLSPRSIWANGHPLKITQNLDCALRSLRYRELFSRVLWIDALCMNQEDLDERSHQVKLMSGVYSGASDVLIWFGPHDDQFDRLMRYLTYHVLPTSVDDRLELLQEAVRLRNLPWFSRVWVAQELVLSANDPVCYLGRRVFRWSTSVRDITKLLGLIYGIDLMERVVTAPTLAKDYINVSELSSFASLREQSTTQSLYERLTTTQSLEASDPRDKVYGILGISSSTNPINPDYTLSTGVVFARAVTTMIQDNEVRIYTCMPLQTQEVGAYKSSLDGLSWVPDFAAWSEHFAEQRFLRPDYIMRSPLLQESWYERAELITTDTCVARVYDEDGTLCAIGRILGTITWRATQGLTDVRETLCWIHEVYDRILKDQGVTPLSFFEVLEDDPEYWDGYGGAPGLNHRVSAFEQFLQYPDPLDEEILDTYLQTLTKMADDVRHRTIFLTDQGQLGRSYHPITDGILPEDLLVGLFGIDMPFLLRPQNDGGYRMINVALVADHVWGTTPGYEELLPKRDWSNLEELGLKVFKIA